ncbi:MAG: hypothetical protein ACM3ZT_10715 [Bacillota bacterium]
MAGRTFFFAAFLAALLAATPARGDTDSFRISADQWALPRSGQALAQLPPLRAAVQDWLAHPGARMVLVHAGSDVGNLWAGELADWLVSLGVPSDQVDKRASAEQGEDSLTIQVSY